MKQSPLFVKWTNSPAMIQKCQYIKLIRLSCCYLEVAVLNFHASKKPENIPVKKKP